MAESANAMFSNPYLLGSLIGVFVLYPWMCWRDGWRETAGYWLHPADFSGPAECWGSMQMGPSKVYGSGLFFGHFIGIFHAFLGGFLIFGTALMVLMVMFGIQPWVF